MQDVVVSAAFVNGTPAATASSAVEATSVGPLAHCESPTSTIIAERAVHDQ
jgi:hypothetical protein